MDAVYVPLHLELPILPHCCWFGFQAISSVWDVSYNLILNNNTQVDAVLDLRCYVATQSSPMK